MKISSEQIENRQIKLNIEMEEPEIEKYLQKAYQKLTNRISVPGFRKGKTPKDVLENLIGKETLLQEAIDNMIPEVYAQAIDQQKIVPIAQPRIEVLQMNPVSFKAIVPIKPDVHLGDYKGIKVDFLTSNVEAKEIESTLEQIRYQQSALIPVERPAALGDVVTIDVSGEEHGQALPLRKDLVYELIKSNSLPLPGFAEKIVGISKGEERLITLTYPTDYEINDLAGKEYKFRIQLKEIKRRDLPEINDEFAISVGNQNMAELREQIASQLKVRNERRADAEYEEKIFDKLVEICSVDYPPVLSDIELDAMIDEEIKNFPDGMKGLEAYLNTLNKTIEEHKKELLTIARQRVVRSLILNKVSETEGIHADDIDLDKEIEKMTNQSENNSENIRKLFSLPQPRKSLEQFIIRQKTLEYLKNIAKENIC